MSTVSQYCEYSVTAHLEFHLEMNLKFEHLLIDRTIRSHPHVLPVDIIYGIPEPAEQVGAGLIPRLYNAHPPTRKRIRR